MANVFTDQPTPSFSDTTLATTYAGADPGDSWTPTNGDIVFVLVGNTGSSALVPDSLAGNGQTWTQVATLPFNTNGTPTYRLTVYRALIAAASAGVLTVTFASNQTGCLVVVVSVAGSKTTGTNGADAHVQVATAYLNETGLEANNTLGFVELADFINH